MPTRIRLAEIIKALSRALDLTEGQPPGHCIACCHIGTSIGRALGLEEYALRDLYYTLMLKDLGCSSNAAAIQALFRADDIAIKQKFKHLDGSTAQNVKFILENTAANGSLVQKLRGVLSALSQASEQMPLLFRARCENGADIARQMRFSEDVALGIRELDEHFDGSGQPYGKRGEDIHLFSRITLLAQVVEVYFRQGGMELALDIVHQRSGTWFDPRVVRAFQRVAARHHFWTTLTSPHLEQIVLGEEPGLQAIMADEAYLDDIAAGFARVIDAKSPYTSGHSQRVAEYTDMIAAELHFSPQNRRSLKRAALLHDIGKLGVSNRVLDKQGPLDDDEWVAMRLHAQFSQTILAHVNAFHNLAVIGGAHHERLDGKGYPLGLRGDEITLETRIVSVADVFDALTAHRPYRAAMSHEDAFAILWKDAGSALDPICVKALETGLKTQKETAA